MIGVDEANNGSLIGPTVICAVRTDKDKLKKILRKLNVKDSKKLKVSTKFKIFNQLKNQVDWFCTKIDVHEIDKNHGNLNSIMPKYVLHTLNYFKNFWEEDIYIDLFSSDKEEYFQNLVKEKDKLNLKQIDGVFDKLVLEHKADENYLIVSLASIFAFCVAYEDLRAEKLIWGEFGSGCGSDVETIKFIITNYDCPIIRKENTMYKKLLGITDEITKEIIENKNNKLKDTKILSEVLNGDFTRIRK